jgi:rhamnose transport system permease protein
VSIFGGRGALHGVIGGVLLIGVLASALRLANVTSDVINIITGVLLVLSVVSSSILAWVQSKRAKPGVSRPLTTVDAPTQQRGTNEKGIT